MKPSRALCSCVLLALLSVVALSAQAKPPVVAPEKMVKSKTGLQYAELREGKGAVAEKGRTVRVLYTGWLKSGRVFDSRTDRNKPLAFTIGAGGMIKGWEEGVTGMRVGGKRLIIIPPALGYGAKAVPNIPPNSELTFEVELVGVNKGST
jgi:peptidylprolyl isomerase